MITDQKGMVEVNGRKIRVDELIRAWKDPDYRTQLSHLLGRVPHPSGYPLDELSEEILDQE
ncbi:mersacidin/lichenicidin family type 2 lantibiotic [Brevibacillus thermoruber]|jgi:mersacidin/lichenicidin family type 2 lantibiotic|uniref:mersacidin/lichenicidin family type 2 lantibiotic n=1 Tax=Brevibacillus thermoruber TaxID=33942 RepID=UPI00055257DE|nr:mersacidin/lichenicidin family type 2 lantibiotic [Brevibacillus thermoruber]